MDTREALIEFERLVRLRILYHVVVALGVPFKSGEVLEVHALDGTILTIPSLAVGDGRDAQIARVGLEPLAGFAGRVDNADSNGLIAVEEFESLTDKEAVSVAALVNLSEQTGEPADEAFFTDFVIVGTSRGFAEGNRVVSDLLGGSSGDESDSKELNILIIN